MFRIFAAIALALGFMSTATSTHAQATLGVDLRLVQDTQLPNFQGGSVALCHVTDGATLLFVPVFTRINSYALSDNGCNGIEHRVLSSTDFTALQANGVIASDLPAVPRASLAHLIWGHAWVVIAGLGLLFAGAILMGQPRLRTPGTADPLAIHSLVAMSQVAVADGTIDAREVQEISYILTRLTGRGYSPDTVQNMLNRLNPSISDLAQVGQDLSDADRQIVLEAALNIAVADGDIHPSEYAVVSDLAHRMRIGATEFRNALGRISAHLQTVQPA